MSEFKQDTYYEEGSDAGPMPGAHIDEFLRSPNSTWLLKLATLKEDGWPMIVPLWYQWDGEAFYVVGRKRSKWVADLKNDPRCAICIEETAHPRIRKVIAQCTAEIVEGPAVGEGSQWVPVANEMATRYSGPDGPEMLKMSWGWERYLVKLVPRRDKLTTWQGADWALSYFDPGQRPDLEAKAAVAGAGTEAAAEGS
jgi:general stress protein 26